MMKKRAIRVLIASVLSSLPLLALASRAGGAVPTFLVQQGRLVDKAGAPVSGELPFVFSLYEAVDATTALYTETQTITLDGGYFSARLGEITPFPAELFNGRNLWIGVKVGADEEMQPRQPVGSVPYAIKAGSADHATSATTATNATGDITPRSISVGGKLIVDQTGALQGIGTSAIPRLSVVAGETVASAGTDPNESTASATVNCPQNARATGGGCNAAVSGQNRGNLKASYPVVQDGQSVGWFCMCVASQAGEPCNVQPYAICTGDSP